MITRATLRRGACWAGLAIGAAALAALVVSVIRPVTLTQDGYRTLLLQHGALELTWNREGWMTMQSFAQPTRWRWLPKWQETGWLSNSGGVMGTPGEFIMPLWIPAAAGLLCLYWLLPEHGPRHECARCRYDLRGVPRKDGARTCPECGTVAA